MSNSKLKWLWPSSKVHKVVSKVAQAARQALHLAWQAPQTLSAATAKRRCPACQHQAKKLAWLEATLAEAADLAWPAPPRSFDEVARLHVLYSDLEAQPGYSDFHRRMLGVRATLTSELLQGTLDKWGHSRDDEKRAALHVLNTLLAFAPAVHRQYDELCKRRDEMAERAASSGGIHGDDALAPTRIDEW